MPCTGANGAICTGANGEAARPAFTTVVGSPTVSITNITTSAYRVVWTPDAALKARILHRTAGSSEAMIAVLVDGAIGFWDAPGVKGDQICCVRFENLTTEEETEFTHFNVLLTQVIDTFDDDTTVTFDDTFNTMDEGI